MSIYEDYELLRKTVGRLKARQALVGNEYPNLTSEALAKLVSEQEAGIPFAFTQAQTHEYQTYRALHGEARAEAYFFRHYHATDAAMEALQEAVGPLPDHDIAVTEYTRDDGLTLTVTRDQAWVIRKVDGPTWFYHAGKGWVISTSQGFHLTDCGMTFELAMALFKVIKA